jgi:hypothetical protein
MSAFVGILSLAFTNYRYGYFNQFDDAINHRIRELLEVPAEGNMKVNIVDDSIHHEQ